MTITLEQLVGSVQRGHLTITAETSGSLVLALAEQLLPAPRRFSLPGVRLTQSGQLILEEGEAVTSLACEAQLRALLSSLLEHVGAEHRPLVSCARTPSQSLAQFLDALQHSLVPMNRAAAKRALSRLHRRLQALGQPAQTGAPARLIEPPALPLALPVASLPAEAPATPEAPDAVTNPVAARADSAPLAPSDSLQFPPLGDWSGLDTSEGTPYLGSFLSVTPRVVFAQPRPACTLNARAELCATELLATGLCATELDASELDARLLELESTPELEGPTEPLQRRDAARPAAVAAVAVGPFFGRFVPRKSALTELLSHFTFETGATPHRHASSLRQSLGISPERCATLTPPNVRWLPASARQS